MTDEGARMKIPLDFQPLYQDKASAKRLAEAALAVPTLQPIATLRSQRKSLDFADLVR